MKKLLSMLGAVLVLAAGPAARAASVTNSVSDLAIAPDALATLLRSLNTPDTYNRLFLTLTNSVFGGANQSNSYFQFVRDLNLKFKAFDATGAGEKAGLGVEYDYNKSIAGRTIGATNPVGLSLAFHAKGNVAFDQERNPDDFLETGLKFHVFQSRGGWEPRMVEEIPADRTKISPLQQLTDEIYLRKKKGNMTEAERQLDPDWQAFLNYVRNHLDTQFFWDAAGNLALESNQDFSKQQWAYGLQVGGVVRAWRDDSAWARWNVLDWPFATIRFLSGADKEFTPSGQALPALLGGIDLVDPTHDDDRFAADPDKGAYPRLRAEAAFKTGLGRLMGKPVWFSAGYRYFREIDASKAIRAARLDEHSYVGTSVEFPGGISVTYSAGKLPFDRRSDNVLALGYKLNF